MKCKYRKLLNDQNFCLTACRYCTSEQERNCKSKILDGTNADRIRSMSDEELAEWLDKIINDCDFCMCHESGICTGSTPDCPRKIIDWLRQPADEAQP